MKNKKIILGLGTITALGAMSVGFIACVKEKEVKKIVDEAGYSKLTKEQVEGLLKNVSTLTEAQMKNLIANLSTLTKEEIQELLNNSLVVEHKEALEFSMEADKYLNKETNKSLNHFESKKKVQDVINRINTKLESKGWSVVEDPTRDNITWFTSKDIKEANGKVLGDGTQTIKFKLK
ncbi:MAG: hypothetical protein E7Y34_02310, partial [Mycoplasma sp.]|nr:hypothetical protein [Mycoplasma sp.]